MSLKKNVVWMAVHVAPKPVCTYYVSINGAFTDVQVTHAMGSNRPTYHRYWLLHFAVATIRLFLLFSLEDATSMISKKTIRTVDCAFVDAAVNGVYPQIFSDMIPSPCNNILYTVS